jgi:hypothetical protein
MLKLLEVDTVAEAAMVRLLKVSVPEFAIDDPSFIVIVPVGAKVIAPLIVKVLLTKKFADGCVVGSPAIVSPLKINDPLLVMV